MLNRGRPADFRPNFWHKIREDLLDGGVALSGEAFDAHEEFCIGAIKSCMLLRGYVQLKFKKSILIHVGRSDTHILCRLLHMTMPFPSMLKNPSQSWRYLYLSQGIYSLRHT